MSKTRRIDSTDVDTDKVQDLARRRQARLAASLEASPDLDFNIQKVSEGEARAMIASYSETSKDDWKKDAKDR